MKPKRVNAITGPQTLCIRKFPVRFQKYIYIPHIHPFIHSNGMVMLTCEFITGSNTNF